MAARTHGGGSYRQRRLAAVLGLAAVAFVIGVVTGAGHRDGRLDVAEAYTRAFARGDWTTMYARLTDDARQRVTLATFARTQRDALALATARRLVFGAPSASGDEIRVPATVSTRIFGTVRAPLVLPLQGDGADARVAWRPDLAFPGLRAGEALSRETTLPPRATLLTRDGQVLAEGDARTPAPAMADVAAQTVGGLGPIPPERAAELRALGVPDGTKVGVRGLERALDVTLLGRPGGVLRAGGRVLAQSAPRRAAAVRTTVAPDLERTAVAALAGRLGGVVALDPRTGEVLAFAGIAFSGLQPPGSTFKMITLSGALEAGITKPSEQFPVQTAATLSGVQLSNANGESCGGTLAQSFAESCNSVFGPLGVRLGAPRLVATAQRFGFNAAPDIPGAATSTIPAAGAIGDDLAVGSTAIGQGEVLATTLQMATVAATIGMRGRRPALTLDLAAARSARPHRGPRVVSTATARTAEKLMLGVVRFGTGTSAAIANVRVAGKTGTAELQSTQDCQVEDGPDASSEDCQAGDPTDTDAWFAAYAPAGDGRPRVAVCVMLVRSGAGGDTAAPAAREVLAAALRRG